MKYARRNYFCKRCKDRNWIIQCDCGCGLTKSRCDYQGRVYTYIKGHYRNVVKSRYQEKIKNAICSTCGSKETFVRKNGLMEWYTVKDKLLCSKCYQQVPKNRERKNKWSKQYHKKLQYYKTKNVNVGYEPKIGVCNWCRAVVPFDCKKTHMHHVQYHDDDPTKDTIEICISCHRIETAREQKSISNEKIVCSNCGSNKTRPSRKYYEGTDKSYVYFNWAKNPFDKSKKVCRTCYSKLRWRLKKYGKNVTSRSGR